MGKREESACGVAWAKQRKTRTKKGGKALTFEWCDDEIRKRCLNSGIDCDHCTRNPDLEEQHDCFVEKDDEEQEEKAE